MDIEKIEQYVIDYVKALRIKKGLSQEDIAQILGKSKSFVGNIESPKNRAKYNLVHINALADYFQISPKDFLPELPF
jgi:transcriptional regulator with XRE-family HTH domain